MKKSIFIFVCLFIGAQSFAQKDTIQGYLKYNVERSFFHQLPNGKRELFSTSNSTALLYYKGKETLYKEITKDNISENQEKRVSNGSVTIIPGNVDMVQSLVYKSYDKSEITYSFSPVQGRLGNFLRDTIRDLAWESTNEESTINKRKCVKFILKSFFNTNWTAWIDLSVPFNEGPWRFYNLPGLLVELSADNGTQKYALQEIGLGTALTNTTLFPDEINNAKVYNKTEYEKIEKEKRERIRLIMEQNNKQNQQQ